LGKNPDELLLLGRYPGDGAPGLLPQVAYNTGVAEDQTRAGKNCVSSPFLVTDRTAPNSG